MPDLTTQQAAEELQLTPGTVCAWAARGDLPGAYQLGRQWRIPSEALDALKRPAPLRLPPRNRRSAAQQRRTA